MEKGQEDKLLIEQLRVEIGKLREQLEEERTGNEDSSDYSLVPNKQICPQWKILERNYVSR